MEGIGGSFVSALAALSACIFVKKYGEGLKNDEDADWAVIRRAIGRT